jgi:hypothetical protein
MTMNKLSGDEMLSLFEAVSRLEKRGELGSVQARQFRSGIMALASSPPAEKVAVPKWLIDFLNGEVPDPDGHWFGERVDDKPYWWRSKHLLPLAVTGGPP